MGATTSGGGGGRLGSACSLRRLGMGATAGDREGARDEGRDGARLGTEAAAGCGGGSSSIVHTCTSPPPAPLEIAIGDHLLLRAERERERVVGRGIGLREIDDRWAHTLYFNLLC